jgi:hypothetical protein
MDVNGDWDEKTDSRLTETGSQGLGQEGIRSMQGATTTTDKAAATSDDPVAITDDPVATDLGESPKAGTVQPPLILDEASDLPYDPAKLEYRLGSPHKDYQLYKDLEAANRRHELGQQAATANGLGEAAANTAAAYKESHGPETETPMDRYFYEKYGRAPYTEAAYPNDESGEETDQKQRSN